MILFISKHLSRFTASLLFNLTIALFWVNIQAYATETRLLNGPKLNYSNSPLLHIQPKGGPFISTSYQKPEIRILADGIESKPNAKINLSVANSKYEIDGPSQPEMSSFKSVGASDMVNLFTGDFNYNVPLLDVGGYPVNLHYTGSVSPEQEASWVGLGWNLNPGNINRNVRGVPDDFNGQDSLIQVQKMKANKTWSLNAGIDFEVLGVKKLGGVNLGMSFNNNLGPEINLTVRGNLSGSVGLLAGSEKLANSSSNLRGSMSLSSRSGASFTALANLSSKLIFQDNDLAGLSLSTGYNTRSGIKALNLQEQHSFNRSNATNKSAQQAQNVFGNGGYLGTSITFNKPSYIPTLRLPITNTAWTGRFQLGLGLFGLTSDIETEISGMKSEIANEDTVLYKKMVGYLYYQEAQKRPDYVLDFTRFNDKEVTPSTPIISIPQYSYDVFSIQGEGTGGSIRLYRNDFGYVRDNFTISKDKNIASGVDVGPKDHFGGNFAIVKSPSSIGEWVSGNKLNTRYGFSKSDSVYESAYFRNPGETNVVDPERLNRVGGTDLVRFVLGGTNQSPTIEPKLQRYNSTIKEQNPTITLSTTPLSRAKRSQYISYLSAEEASKSGLDLYIRSYDQQSPMDPVQDTLKYESISRVEWPRKPHHISQINVTEKSGKRYVYGIPVYNHIQTDYNFSVYTAYTQIPDKVGVSSAWKTVASGLLNDTSTKDGYLQISKTPAYAHSFLLSGLLSEDYVDITGNGITEDDLGDAVKFNYSRIKQGSNIRHIWRSPLTLGDSANFASGNRSETKDDKAIVSYGERESWYLHSLESKSMIAFFFISDRRDGKGASGIDGGVNTSEKLVKKLDSISLYNKAELKAKSFAGAKPIKTVIFRYSYNLCKYTPDNNSGHVDSLGRLTLDSILFTYNGVKKAVKSRYSFYYVDSSDLSNVHQNPNYAAGQADRWGNYKPQNYNPASLRNSDYPYVINDSSSCKEMNDKISGAWLLKKIVIPSGAEISIKYESDDYAFVQQKRASDMMKIIGFGNSSNLAKASNRLYQHLGRTTIENDYIFISVPEACVNSIDVKAKYLQDFDQLAFKLFVTMPKGQEYISCFSGLESYGVSSQNAKVIWIKLKLRNGKSPVSIAALEFLRQQLPGQAFKGYDVSESQNLKQIADMLLGMFVSLKDAFKDPINSFREDGKAMIVDLSKSFVRLSDPDGVKYGGGNRVKSMIIRDNWNRMTGQFTASYGKTYDYTTTEIYQGIKRRISSGVASYEPGLGGEENPFQSVVEIQDKLPLGPTAYGAVEMPILDAFFPAALVGYSKVTVRSLKNDTIAGKKTRSGIGKQVTEYYTAKDFPVQYSYTSLDAAATKEFHQNSLGGFLKKYNYDYKALSQGFLIQNNDMHGKMKARSSYSEKDSTSRISYEEHFYRNTGKNGSSDKFTFIDYESGGTAALGNMGIDVELMTDTREFSVRSSSIDVQAQVEILTPIVLTPVWMPNSITENIYRAVTTTKVVDFHGVLDSIVVIDKGSMVSTKNMAYDAQTGDVLVTRTRNIYNKPVYNSSIPAYWAYSGMGPSYKNNDAKYGNVQFSDGKIVGGSAPTYIFEAGDELLILSATDPLTGCDLKFKSGQRTNIWVTDKNKNHSSLSGTPDFIFVDSIGIPYTMNNVSFRIVRSGKRNMLEDRIASYVSLADPLSTGKLKLDLTTKVVQASAVEYRERWYIDNDAIKRVRTVIDPETCIAVDVDDSSGVWEKNINVYRKGLLGNFRTYRNMVFYDERVEFDSTGTTNLMDNGVLKNFKSYWNFNASNKLFPDTISSQWVWNSRIRRVNSKGMELEVMDALGVFTSAQYGYGKNLPVAISKNARSQEMYFDSFEDYEYDEHISRTVYNPFRRYFNFKTMANSNLINTDTAQFLAHTGKMVWAIGAGKTDSIAMPVNNLQNGEFPLFAYGKDSLKTLTNTGGLYGFTSISPIITQPQDRGTPVFGNSSFTLAITPKDTIEGGVTRRHYYTFTDTFYIEIGTKNTYNFNVSMNTSYNHTGVTVYSHSNGLNTMIFDLYGNPVSNHTLTQNGFSYTSGSYSVTLCPGIYKIIQTGTELYVASNNGLNYTTNNYSWQASNNSSPDYKNLTMSISCIYNKAIPATDSLLNQTFRLQGGKKYIISAWVKENCGDPASGIPCKNYTYSYNQIQVRLDGPTDIQTSLSPSGPIIDGWQRYEGVIEPRSTDQTVIIKFMNTGATTVYFDDFRIHPFNATMKSYVYNPVNLKLVAELDENNYASFFEYDEEGNLVRTKVETKEGVKTITESRSTLQTQIK